jgi:hypothetical protein
LLTEEPKKLLCPIIDVPAKNRFSPFSSFLAEAGIQFNQAFLDPRLRGSDGLSGFLRVHHHL